MGCQSNQEESQIESTAIENSTDPNLLHVDKDDFYKVETIDLTTLEGNSGIEKQAMMAKLKVDYGYISQSDNWTEEHSKYFHFLDLDVDGDLDVIYDGWSGGEPVCIRIHLNIEGHFKQVFEAYQSITKIEFNKEGLSEIAINDPGCCTAYINFDEVWTVSAAKDSLNFKLKRRVAVIAGNTAPDNLFKTSKRFTVDQSKYYLRLHPKIDTVDVWHDGFPFQDNIIAEYTKGAAGTALGQTIDSTGRIWWYVEMDADADPISSEFYDIENNPTLLTGWMSSRYLNEGE